MEVKFSSLHFLTHKFSLEILVSYFATAVISVIYEVIVNNNNNNNNPNNNNNKIIFDYG